MLNRILITICTVAVVVTFFQPWFIIKSPAIGALSRVILNEDAPSKTFSGYDIPQKANSNESKQILAIIKIFKPDVKEVDKLSQWVYAIPGVAVFFFLVSRVTTRDKIFNVLMLIVGFGFSAYLYYKLTQVANDKMFVKLELGRGLLITLYAYVGYGVVGLLGALTPGKSRKK